MKKFKLTFEYNGVSESWEQIRNDAENNKIKNVFIGTKEFVNVVRCKECDYGITHGITDGFVFCSKPYQERGNAMHRCDWFCADAVRKDYE